MSSESNENLIAYAYQPALDTAAPVASVTITATTNTTWSIDVTAIVVYQQANGMWGVRLDYSNLWNWFQLTTSKFAIPGSSSLPPSMVCD